MSATTQFRARINGKTTELLEAAERLSIESRYNGHHTFELQIPISRSDTVNLATIEEHLGEPINITLEDSGTACSFRGFLDEAIPVWSADGGRTITLKGWSPTVFLDCGPVFRCFAEKSLDEVVRKVLKPYQRFFPEIKINTKQNQQVTWSVQSYETDFQYLCRLADQSGLQECWYDGHCLYFDDLTQAETTNIHLIKGENLHQVQVSLNTAPLTFSIQAYDYINGCCQQESVNPLASNNPLIRAALNKSTYPNQCIFLPYPLEGGKALRSLLRRFASKQAHELMMLSGQSNESRLKVGSRITLDHQDDMLEQGLTQGQYVIIQISHRITKHGLYQNNWVAVPTSHPYNLRMSDGPAPMSGPMAAVVMDCDDPMRLGRVRVQFLADCNEKAISPWLRCLTPYTSDGGAFLIPKKHEQVLVFAEGFNLERGAFVLNSYFHKQLPAHKWQPITQRGWRWGQTGTMFTNKGDVNTWGDKVELNARESWSLDAGKRGDLNSGKGTIPK